MSRVIKCDRCKKETSNDEVALNFSKVLGFSSNNENELEIETKIKEATGKVLAPIRNTKQTNTQFD